MFFAREVWCIADVSSIRTSSEKFSQLGQCVWKLAKLRVIIVL